MSGFTYPHELAHNMGTTHDWYVSSGIPAYKYAHGHVDVTNKFLTIMAYRNRCVVAGIVCQEIGVFSNPKRRFGGAKTGVGGSKTNCKAGKTSPSGCAANNALAINNTRKIVAAFR